MNDIVRHLICYLEYYSRFFTFILSYSVSRFFFTLFFTLLSYSQQKSLENIFFFAFFPCKSFYTFGYKNDVLFMLDHNTCSIQLHYDTYKYLHIFDLSLIIRHNNRDMVILYFLNVWLIIWSKYIYLALDTYTFSLKFFSLF